MMEGKQRFVDWLRSLDVDYATLSVDKRVEYRSKFDAGQGTSGSAHGGGVEHFRLLLKEAADEEGFLIEESVLVRIAKNPALANQAAFATNSGVARSIYRTAQSAIQTTAKQQIMAELQDLVIDGQMFFGEAERAQFFRVFTPTEHKDLTLQLLKIPTQRKEAEVEAGISSQLSVSSHEGRHFCVPVRLKTWDRLTVTQRTAGVVMPLYVCTLADLPRAPVLSPLFVSTVRRVLSAMEAFHSLGLIHGDIKPHNIFFDAKLAFLGDFGSAQRRSETLTVSSTLHYIPREHQQYMHPVESLDYGMLALTVLDLAGVYYPLAATPTFAEAAKLAEGIQDKSLSAIALELLAKANTEEVRKSARQRDDNSTPQTQTASSPMPVISGDFSLFS